MWDVKPGDLVVSIKEGPWRKPSTGETTSGPTFGTICTVTRVLTIGWSHPGFLLEGWQGVFRYDRFRPIQKPSIESLRGLLVPKTDRELADA